MARKRSIKPEFFDDETLANCSRDARLLYIGLWCHMDGQCLIEASTRLIKLKVFPFEEITHKDVELWLQELIVQKRLAKFHWNGKELLHCPTLKKHCRIYDDEKKNFNVPEEFLTSLTDYAELQPTPAQIRAEPGGNVTASVGSGSIKEEEEVKRERAKKENSELDNFIAECFSLYPRRSNTRKAEGLSSIKSQLLAKPSQRESFKTAILNYAEYIKLESKKPNWQESYTKQFITFCGSLKKQNWVEWVDWVAPEIKAPQKPAPKSWEPRPINYPPVEKVLADGEAFKEKLEAEHQATPEEIAAALEKRELLRKGRTA